MLALRKVDFRGRLLVAATCPTTANAQGQLAAILLPLRWRAGTIPIGAKPGIDALATRSFDAQ